MSSSRRPPWLPETHLLFIAPFPLEERKFPSMQLPPLSTGPPPLCIEEAIRRLSLNVRGSLHKFSRHVRPVGRQRSLPLRFPKLTTQRCFGMREPLIGSIPLSIHSFLTLFFNSKILIESYLPPHSSYYRHRGHNSRRDECPAPIRFMV